MKKISCIIPTYNEGPRIRKVLKTVIGHPLIDEIIIVDDGSIDDTQKIISEFKDVHLVIHEKNQGKSKAVCSGVIKAKNDFLFLLDADLVGLQPDDITTLLGPVVTGSADVSISLRRNAPGIFKLIDLDYISGERVLPKDVLSNYLEEIAVLPKFGLESFMNTIIIKNKYRLKIVHWNNVDSPYQNKKNGFWKGTQGEILKVKDIFNTIGFFGPYIQILKMLRLKIK